MFRPYFITRFALMQFCIIQLLPVHLSAQNLVPNGDFEQHEKCPAESAQYNLLKSWESASEATPDLFCNCASETSLVSTTQNFAGRQAPRSGNCYAGILAWHSDEYYEYLMVKLDAPMVKGKKYLLSFFYSLSDFSDKQVYALGILFQNEKNILPEHPMITEPATNDSISNNIREWKEFNVVHTATGDEQYLVIGCFTPGITRAYGDKPPQGFGPSEGDHFAYYYLEDVSLTPYNGKPLVKKEPEKKNTGTPVSFDAAMKKPFRLEKIYFDTDKSELLPASFTELNQLVTYLKAHPKYKIALSGHTDNTGNAADNQRLSNDRAKAVATYLSTKGIAGNRITSKGFGSTNPIAPNDTPANKQKNRRVEFTLTSK